MEKNDINIPKKDEFDKDYTLECEGNIDNIVNKKKTSSSFDFRNINSPIPQDNEKEGETNNYHLNKISDLKRSKSFSENNTSNLFRPIDLSFVDPILAEEFKKEDEHLTEQLFDIIIIDEMCSISLTLLSLLNGLAYYEIKKNINDEPSETQNKLINYTLIICSISSILFIILLVPKYYHYFLLYKSAQYSFSFDKIYDNYLLLYAFIEFFFAIIHPNILFKNSYFTTKTSWNLVEVTYNVNDILLVIHLCRVFYIFKLMIMFSNHYGARADRVNKMIGRHLSMFFSFRSLLISQTALVLIVLTTILVIVLAYQLRIIEGQSGLINQKIDYSNFLDCVWNILVTMTTVGYGDYYPKSVLGRVIGSVIALLGSFVVAMIVSFFEKLTFLDDKEQISYHFIQRLKCKDKVNLASMEYVASFVRYRLYRNKLIKGIVKLDDDSKKNLINLAKKKVKDHRNYKHQLHRFHINYTMENAASILKIKVDNVIEVSQNNTEKLSILDEKMKKLIDNIEKFQMYKKIPKFKKK